MYGIYIVTPEPLALTTNEIEIINLDDDAFDQSITNLLTPQY
tara:strand:+ start:760 stop:885 length:126 start_codon:yes stop_codon:yes gene_type:complete